MIDLVLLLSVPVLFGVSLKRPDRALLLWLLLSPLSQDPMRPFGVEIPISNLFDRLGTFAIALGLLASGQFWRLFANPFSKFEKAIVIFILIFLLEGVGEGLVPLHPREILRTSYVTFDTFIIPCFFYFLLKYLLTRGGTYNDRMEDRMATTLTLVGFYLACMSVYEGITLHDLFPAPESNLSILMGGGLRIGSPRTNGPFYQPEILGQYLSLILLFFLYRWRVRLRTRSASRTSAKGLAIPYILLMLFGMYFNQFRSIWLGFFGGHATRYIFSRRGRLTFLLVVFLVSILGATTWHMLSRTQLYVDRITNTETFYSRVSAWLYAFRAFSEHPLMGLGYDQLRLYIFRAHDAGDDMRFMGAFASFSAHNTFITMLAENGILLTVPFCFLVCYFFGQVRTRVRSAQSYADVEFSLFAVAAGFAIFFVQLFDRMYYFAKFQNLVFVIFALVTARNSRSAGAIATTASADEASMAARITERKAQDNSGRTQSTFVR